MGKVLQRFGLKAKKSAAATGKILTIKKKKKKRIG